MRYLSENIGSFVLLNDKKKKRKWFHLFSKSLFWKWGKLQGREKVTGVVLLINEGIFDLECWFLKMSRFFIRLFITNFSLLFSPSSLIRYKIIFGYRTLGISSFRAEHVNVEIVSRVVHDSISMIYRNACSSTIPSWLSLDRPCAISSIAFLSVRTAANNLKRKQTM